MSVSLVYLCQASDAYGAKLLVSAFAAGAITAAIFGWFPRHLPELFPTGIGATAQGFSFNFGRVLSAVGSLHTATLTAYFAAGVAPDQIETAVFPSAGAILGVVYLIGLFVIWLGPETKRKPPLS